MSFRKNRLEIIKRFRDSAPEHKYDLKLNEWEKRQSGEHDMILTQAPFELSALEDSLYGYDVACLRDTGFLSSLVLDCETIEYPNKNPTLLICEFTTDLSEALCVTEGLCHWLRCKKGWNLSRVMMQRVFTSSSGSDWEEFPALALAETLNEKQEVFATLSN